MDIFKAVSHGSWAEYLREIKHHDVNVVNEKKRGLLHEAIAYKQREIAMDLLARSIDVNLCDHRGQSALHFLGFHPDPTLTEQIILHGAALEQEDVFGNSPLWYAVFNARSEYAAVKVLLKHGANPLIKNKAGRSPLEFAYQIGDAALIEMLTAGIDGH